MKEYDLIIIGGGAAGFAAANTANKLKKRTLIINDSSVLPIGGTCVNVGCVPTKIMLHQGNLFYYSTKNKFRAIKLQGKADFIEALKETREMVKGFQESNYRNVIEKQEYVDFKEGSGSFIDSHTLKVGNQEFRAKCILISTGASVFVPEIKGIEDIDYITNANIFSLDKAPESVIIIGGGAMSMEFSQIFHHFGIKVTILQRSERVLSKLDPMIGERVKQDFEKEGINIYTKTSIKELQNTENGVKAIIEVHGDEKTIFAEKLMIASGLSPHTKEINIKKSGVNLSKRGFVKVNEYMQTSQENIYAAGDVTGIMPLETVAAKQGNIAVLNMFENANKKLNYNTIPQAIFTSPEIAVVGITEDESMEKYNNCLCSTVEMKHIEKALALKDTRGFIKMVLEPDTKRIIGVHIYAAMAADIITTGVYAIENRMTIYDVRDIVHVFPTMSEMIKKAAQSFEQNLDEMACCVE